MKAVPGEALPIQRAQDQAGSLSEGLRLRVDVVEGACWAYGSNSYSAPGHYYHPGREPRMAKGPYPIRETTTL